MLPAILPKTRGRVTGMSRIRKISIRFARGVRALIWMCGVCIEKASSVGTETLLSLPARLPAPLGLSGDLLGRTLWHGHNGSSILDDTLGDEHEGKNESYRKEDVKGAAGHIYPEVAYPVGRLAGDSPHHCNRYADACSCGKEVLDCKTGHLGKVACCRFTTIDLPVCVSDKTGSSVDCKVQIKSP